jgi:butyryl-CoA dehydrogenase
MVLLTDEQQMVRDMVREFATSELAPLAPELDAENRFAADAVPKLGALELLGLAVPEAHGGAGVDRLTYALAVEEIARSCPSTALLLLTHSSLVARAISARGTEAQRRKWLPPLLRGEQLGAFALSEAEAGSDVGAMRAKAELRGKDWVISGTKTFVPGAAGAGLFLVVARTQTDEPFDARFGLFAVEAQSAGVQVDTQESFMGLRGAGIGRLSLQEVVLPGDHAIGAPSASLDFCETMLDEARLGLAALAVGIAQHAFERTLQYAHDRPQFDRRIAEHQSVQWRLADMALDVSAARALVQATCGSTGSAADFRIAAALAKVLASEAASRVCDHAIQVHGGYGYTVEYHVERLYRDAKMCEILYGTSDVLRLLVAQTLAGASDSSA